MRKSAIVTGGGRGIGYAVSRRLLEQGCDVLITGTSAAETYADALRELNGAGGKAEYFSADIAKGSDREACVRRALELFGKIDILVNNAGVAPLERVDILNTTEESFDRVMDINLRGTFFLTQHVANRMLQQAKTAGKRGTIVNIASISSYTSSVNRAEYCLSKAGISMMTQLFADRLADEGIYVFEVRPGIIATDMTAAVKHKYDALFAQGLCPIKRWGLPEDVAKAVALFCSDDLPYSTGEVINVDGGFHIRRL